MHSHLVLPQLINLQKTVPPISATKISPPMMLPAVVPTAMPEDVAFGADELEVVKFGLAGCE